jgi:hypothetical protein
MALQQQQTGAARAPRVPAPPETTPLYTRYCAAPRPVHPVGEPSYLHALMVAAWLGRLIDPLPGHHRHEHAPQG